MPAASCRIMPARSISRCETISASFGFSFRMGRKNRDNRMTLLEDSKMRRRSESGLRPKIQGRTVRKAAGSAGFRAFVTIRTASLGRHVEIVLEGDLVEIGHQRVDPHVPAAGDCQRHFADMPEAVRLQRALPFDLLDAAF